MRKKTETLKKMTSFDGLVNRLTPCTDQALIKKFHRYPFFSLVLNLITLGLFFAAFGAMSSPDTAICLLLFAAGCLSIILFQRLLPPYYKKAIAWVMMNRYRMPDDTNNSEFFYYYRQEYALLGKLKKSAFEIICKILGIFVKIINCVFNIFTALLVLAVTLMIGILFGGVLWLLHLIAGGNAVILSLSRACFKPVAWAFSFLGRALLLKDYLDFNGRTYSTNDFGTSAKAAPTTDRAMSDAHLREYISLPEGPFSVNAQWDGTASISVYHSSITVSGRIRADAASYHEDYELEQCIEQFKDDVHACLSSQIEKYRADYPNSSDIEIILQIEGYIG